MEKVSDYRSHTSARKVMYSVCRKHLCMTIYVNNNACELPAASVVADALSLLNIPAQKGIALAVNSNVIPALDWGNYALKENDKIIIIKATQGG